MKSFKNIHLFGLFFFMLITQGSYAQDNELKARSEFLMADQLYGNGDFKDAINHLKSAKELLGNTNPRIQYLLAKAKFELNEFQEASKELDKYFQVSNENDRNYDEMVLMISQIKVALQQQEKEKLDWENAMVRNTIEAYNSFSRKYPNTRFDKELEGKLALLEEELRKKQVERDKVRYDEIKKLLVLEQEKAKKYRSSARAMRIVGWPTAILGSFFSIGLLPESFEYGCGGNEYEDDYNSCLWSAVSAGAAVTGFILIAKGGKKKRKWRSSKRKIKELHNEINSLNLTAIPSVNFQQQSYGLTLNLRF